jgi:hypothetical protein
LIKQHLGKRYEQQVFDSYQLQKCSQFRHELFLNA